MSYEEEAIAKAQATAAKAKGADGLKEHHSSTISYLNERILVFVMLIGLIALVFLWASTDSILLHYGSLLGVILLIVLWGVVRLQRIKKTRLNQEQQVKSWESSDSE